MVTGCNMRQGGQIYPRYVKPTSYFRSAKTARCPFIFIGYFSEKNA